MRYLLLTVGPIALLAVSLSAKWVHGTAFWVLATCIATFVMCLIEVVGSVPPRGTSWWIRTIASCTAVAAVFMTLMRFAVAAGTG